MLGGIKCLKPNAGITAYPENDYNLDKYIAVGLPSYKI